MPLIQKYQQWRRQMIWVGWPICIGGLVAGSFANTLETLILTQGVAYVVGFLILYYPILMMGFGYFFPSLYLPSLATSLDMCERPGPMLLAVMSISQVAGQFAFGYLSDRKIPLDVLASTSMLVASVTTVTMWRLGDSFPVLIAYTLLYGFFGAGFTAIWARMSTTITDDATAGPIVFGPLSFGKGVGNVPAGHIGCLLVHNNSALQHSSAAESLSIVVLLGYYLYWVLNQLWM
ncbi:monocarboxylate transporter 2 [Fusarium napiforme]|uniref:Monocarboxylate transporter 2 n=1 Tax=Fusarium napiforme TaxID=42672 RepID=A0A8H5IDT4_9HYPO|nr:monocarboxylate transporter 2 [Fusarium napiforme]